MHGWILVIFYSFEVQVTTRILTDLNKHQIFLNDPLNTITIPFNSVDRYITSGVDPMKYSKILVLLWFVTGPCYPYPSGLLHWHWGKHYYPF